MVVLKDGSLSVTLFVLSKIAPLRSLVLTIHNLLSHSRGRKCHSFLSFGYFKADCDDSSSIPACFLKNFANLRRKLCSLIFFFFLVFISELILRVLKHSFGNN